MLGHEYISTAKPHAQGNPSDSGLEATSDITTSGSDSTATGLQMRRP